ncbi:hypothetical protein N7462_005002 [Penicillium macrosclerotiorum]|uniref:uncharacterized protein n=1 Tax=Penicillium macrosclerotiorum TaxID=303699 RepID=UPI0025496355|nr:uncharacterized protein N7462_005002 [Penicillium macrosclerotiorum]KAJ5690610.1 hypothetical protein N7462_005002 [Penicillium macrosclerotiorum]
MAYSLPSLPAKHADLVEYINANPETFIQNIIKPYNDFDAVARKIFAQDPSHPLVKDNHANIVPLYTDAGATDIRIRARDLTTETAEQKEKYILTLPDEIRRPSGSTATVSSLAEFQNNFALFTEAALSDLDWSNVVAAGSAVVTSLLPVPDKYRNSKRGLRQYYHEKFAPASDVDLFLYGLTEEQAIEKIKQIENKIRNTILYETTTIRTKNTITIVSQYPTRHVQIVLRIYKSIAEILTGFDVDCSCAAYDGQQVYASPRAIASYITQINQIDLTRRSPSYENRLSKYSHRGFEIFWPALDRSKVDPTIFERSFMRTEGLARLLVLEKLPKTGDRDSYLTKRREERGRPPLSLYLRRRQGKALHGNIKDDWEDEVPDWQENDQISDYHTFTIPYGRRFNAKKIEKLLYTKDLLLNAQWNQPKDREVYLHRHPAFFGEAEHVVGDCCGYCPIPVTEEEQKIAEEESKTFISGSVTFIKDDPGRQEIGSFNPITETDWTAMAYTGRTELLCQAIVSHDLEAVKKFFTQCTWDPDRRDYTGRTPLQLACISSTPEIVQFLVDQGARLIARMADGKTALHLAAARGNAEIVRILLKKSNENEEEEHQKMASVKYSQSQDDGEGGNDKDDTSHTSASYVKLDEDGDEELPPTHDTIEENEMDPDIYDINVVAWDSLASPLHLAILHGHTKTVRELVGSFGADVLMPIKITDNHRNKPWAAILTLVLVLALPLDKAKEMCQTLLELGASSNQADLNHWTPIHYIAQSNYSDLLDVYLEHDGPALQRAINHMAASGSAWSNSMVFCSPLVNALTAKNHIAAEKLLQMGATASFEVDDCWKTAKAQMANEMRYHKEEPWGERGPKQPILFAVENDMPLVAIDLLRRGVNPNSEWKTKYSDGEAVLDRTRHALKEMRTFLKNGPSKANIYNSYHQTEFEKTDDEYMADFPKGSYKRFVIKHKLEIARQNNRKFQEQEDRRKGSVDQPGLPEKKDAITELVKNYELLETELLSRNAVTYAELHPDETKKSEQSTQRRRHQEKNKITTFEAKFFHLSRSRTTEASRKGYVQLFEAAWDGDIDTIKALTIDMWGPEKDQPPLEISLCDDLGSCCLSISVLRGHLRAAKIILQILQAQYKVKKSQTQVRFELDLEGASSDDEALPIVGHAVDDQFTYENIGELAIQVESKVSPLMALKQECGAFRFLEAEPADNEFKKVPTDRNSGYRYIRISTVFKYAIFKNDLALLDWLIKAAQDCTARDQENKSPFMLSQEEFQLAIALGHTECIARLIQATAAGLPLTKMGEASGVESREEPQYYQGLSIRGKKRKDWVEAARPGHNSSMSKDSGRPPLLISATQGKLASTEWFLSTAPSRHYLNYVNGHMEHETIQRLARSEIGLDASVMKWLQDRNELVLHCAVMSHECEESEKLVQYLVDHHPECLEVRSSEGHTPLSLAFSIRRHSFARILIQAGANQAVRDSQGNNLLHLLLVSDRRSEACKDPEIVTKFVELLDKDLVTGMLTERSGGENSRTPFARWLHTCQDIYFCYQDFSAKECAIASTAKVTKSILKLGEPTNQKFLELLDGAGNTPVHDTIRKCLPHILEAILDCRPDLLYRENATGNTPLEMAVDAWVNRNTLTPLKTCFKSIGSHGHEWKNAVERDSKQFCKDQDTRTREEIMMQVCQQRAQRNPGKRRLVTLFEANEVAKRLAVKKSRAEEEVDYCCYDEEDENADKLDEVELWGPAALCW